MVTVKGYPVGTYNTACFLLEKSGARVESVKASKNGQRFGFYEKDGNLIADYDEQKKVLHVY